MKYFRCLLFLFSFGLLFVFQTGIAQETSLMRVGAASRDATPEIGTETFAWGKSVGVKTPLLTQVLYLEKNNERLFWVVNELIAVESDFARQIQNELSGLFQIDQANVLVSATHTHSSPATMRSSGDYWGPYCDVYLDQKLRPLILDAAKEALSNAEDCEMISVEGQCSLSIERRDKPTRHLDQRVPCLAWKRKDGSFKATLLLYAMHPSAYIYYSGEPIVFAAEWPGSVSRALRENLPGNPVSLVLNGACGNINSPKRNPTDEEMFAWGNEIAHSVLEKIMNSQPLENPSFIVTQTNASLEYNVLTEAEIIKTAESLFNEGTSFWDVKRNAAGHDWKTSRLNELSNETGKSRSLDVHGVLLGNRYFLTLPLEVFSRFNLYMNEKRNHSIPVYCVGYTNGEFGYLFHKEAYEEGGYEPSSHLYYNHFQIKQGELECLVDQLLPFVQKTTDSL
ncbi:MAG: hypothetical protein Q4C95_00625 [Planctomycetia bacterium]|nr:hypothetical protein [Planctomycetia bacterium]